MHSVLELFHELQQCRSIWHGIIRVLHCRSSLVSATGVVPQLSSILRLRELPEGGLQVSDRDGDSACQQSCPSCVAFFDSSVFPEKLTSTSKKLLTQFFRSCPQACSLEWSAHLLSDMLAAPSCNGDWGLGSSIRSHIFSSLSVLLFLGPPCRRTEGLSLWTHTALEVTSMTLFPQR